MAATLTLVLRHIARHLSKNGCQITFSTPEVSNWIQFCFTNLVTEVKTLTSLRIQGSKFDSKAEQVKIRREVLSCDDDLSRDFVMSDGRGSADFTKS